ncbi:MAG: hypothetical protein EBU90_08410 [Proteobacteria bacterium]|jgi:hypothetical protein|nr:hypothetical protein [Pseudomonadota bacterium]
MEVIMHNLISFNQLAAWKQLEPSVNEFIDQHELMNDYFNCMIECDDNQQSCKRICREMLSS